MEARIIKYKDRPTEIETDYSSAFLDDFKASIPPALRKWDAERRRWIIRNDADLPVVEAILRDHYEHVSTTLA